MTTRGWCPTVHEPMETGDGLLVRIKPRGGILSASDARLIATQAAAHGNGIIELTARANLQIRGLSLRGADRFARAMVAAGLANPDPAAERRRNVIATPLANIDPTANPFTFAITATLETAIEADNTLASLPAKFSFVVDGGGVLPPVRTRADVRIRLLGDRAEIAYGTETYSVPLQDAVATALAVATHGGWGAPEHPTTHPTPIGPIGTIAFGAGLPFGSASTRVWTSLADLSDALRLTPWRAVLIAGSNHRSALTELGLITDPDDQRLLVSACPGQPACASASVPTRDIAARLRPIAGTIHVSGCDKGCAHPGSATLTLVGRDGTFDLVRNGRAHDPPAERGLSAAEVLAR